MAEMTPQDILKQAGAIFVDGHFVDVRGNHSSGYVYPPAVYRSPRLLDGLASMVADWAYQNEMLVDVVVAPAAAAQFASAVARELTRLGRLEVQAVCVEPVERTVYVSGGEETIRTSVYQKMVKYANVWAEEKLIVRSGQFQFNRWQANILRQQKVLVVTDVMGTGRSLRNLVEEVGLVSGRVLGAATWCNLDDMSQRRLDVHNFLRLSQLLIPRHKLDECPLCRDKVPISTEVGYGEEFQNMIKT